MVKKKIDNRIRVMIENGVKSGHRTLLLLVGDKARDQVHTISKLFYSQNSHIVYNPNQIATGAYFV